MNRKRIAISKGRAGSTLVVMTAILLSAFAFGARGLNVDNIWTDELISLRHMGVFDPPFGPTQTLSSIREFSPNHTPLYFLIGSSWAQLVGWTQLSLRALSLLFGILTVAWLYRFAVDIFNRPVAIVAALLLSTNAFVIVYFHEIRMYSLLMLLEVVHLWCYWRLARSNADGRHLLFGIMASTSALLYTNYLSALLFAGMGIYHVFFASRSRQWWLTLIAWALGFALFLPYLPLIQQGVLFAKAEDIAFSAIELFVACVQVLLNDVWLLGIPLAISISLSLWRARNRMAFALIIVGVSMSIGLLIVNELLGTVSLSRLRYTLLLFPPILVVCAYGLLSFSDKRYAVIATAAFVLIWSFAGLQFADSATITNYSIHPYWEPRYPPLSDYVYHLTGKTQEGDFLIGFSETEIVDFKHKRIGRSPTDYYLRLLAGIDGTFLHTNLKRYRLEKDVRDIMREHPYVLLAYDPGDVPLNYARTQDYIQRDYLPCLVLVDNPDLHIQRYVHPVLGCGHNPAPVEYINGIRILDHASSFEPGLDRIRLLTWWHIPEERMLHEYNISLQLVTPQWQNLRQIDRHLSDRISPWSVIELSTDNLAPGEYWLALILYSRDSGQIIAGDDEDGHKIINTFAVRTPNSESG